MQNFIIVLQGEFAVVDASKMSIVTSRPHTCHVLIAHEKKSNLIGLLHIDCYTAAADITQQLFDTFQHKLQEKNILNPEYEIHYAEGLSDGRNASELAINQMQIKDMLRISINYGQTVEKLILSPVATERHPFQFAIADNNITLNMLAPTTYTYFIVEHLQGIEYGDFNKFLNRCFGRIDPHFFLGKQASRYDTDLPDEKSFSPIVHVETIEKHLDPIVRFERTADVQPSMLKKLKELIDTSNLTPRQIQTFEQTIANKQYNLVLRQTATKTDFLPILNFLLSNSLEFGLDITSCGLKSGSAINVAKVSNNESAHTALSLFKQKQQKNCNEMELAHGQLPTTLK